MYYFDLIDELKRKFSYGTLPGSEAQYKLAPSYRPPAKELFYDSSKHKLSAVLLLLYPGQDLKAKIVLTKRTQSLKNHSGQISFPGGRYDNNDIHIKQTALRETEEELGIEQEKLIVLSELSSLYIPPSNFFVHPFVACLDSKPNFKFNKSEVDSLLEIEIQQLISNQSLSKTTIQFAHNMKAEVPCFNFDNNIVWGATAMILSEFKELLVNNN
jgi:8-oxo-dGTP pyrophosphatase MutT (NUDIX family)